MYQGEKLIAKPLLTMDRVRKLTVKAHNNKFYLMISPKKYIGCGSTVAQAIDDANMRTFSTGYRVVEEA